jgi:hypothetical protein
MVGHDPAADLEVLRRVHGGDAAPRAAAHVGVGDDPAAHDRDVAAAGLAQRADHVRDQLAVRAGQDRQPITCTPSSTAERAICAGVRRMPS